VHQKEGACTNHADIPHFVLLTLTCTMTIIDKITIFCNYV